MTLLTETFRRILQTPHWARVTTTYATPFGLSQIPEDLPDNGTLYMSLEHASEIVDLMVV